MVVRLRLAVHGQRNHRVFHLVAIEGTRRRNAKPIETLGKWNPHVAPGEKNVTVRWSVDRIGYWLAVGAVPTDRVKSMLELASIKPNYAAAPKARPHARPEIHGTSSPEQQALVQS